MKHLLKSTLVLIILFSSTISYPCFGDYFISVETHASGSYISDIVNICGGCYDLTITIVGEGGITDPIPLSSDTPCFKA